MVTFWKRIAELTAPASCQAATPLSKAPTCHIEYVLFMAMTWLSSVTVSCHLSHPGRAKKLKLRSGQAAGGGPCSWQRLCLGEGRHRDQRRAAAAAAAVSGLEAAATAQCAAAGA